MVNIIYFICNRVIQRTRRYIIVDDIIDKAGLWGLYPYAVAFELLTAGYGLR